MFCGQRKELLPVQSFAVLPAVITRIEHRKNTLNDDKPDRYQGPANLLLPVSCESSEFVPSTSNDLFVVQRQLQNLHFTHSSA